jgi:hypothetical protein
MKNGREACLCEKVKEKKWGSCNITPLVALKSPTSVIRIVPKGMVAVEIFILDIIILSFGVERVFDLFHLFIPKILVFLQLIIEVPASRFCLDNSASTEVRTEGGEVSRGSVGADPAVVTDAVDLAVSFFMAVSANEVIVGPAASISEVFLGRGTRVGVIIVRDINPDFGMRSR